MKKGFTLIEMLIVLSVLAILALLIVPIIGREMKEASLELYDEQIRYIEQAAENWGADHLSELPLVDGEKISVTLEILQDGGYVKKKLKNPKTKKVFPSTLEIEIRFQDNHYYYTVLNS